MEQKNRIPGLRRIRELVEEALSLTDPSDDSALADQLREILAHIDRTIAGLR